MNLQPIPKPEYVDVNLSPKLSTDGYQFCKKGLVFTNNLSLEQWFECGYTLKRMDRFLMFAIGDWANQSQRFDVSYGDIVDQTDFEYSTIKDAAYVARNVPMSIRNDNLFYSHHKAIACLKTEEEKKYWLDKAEQNQMSVRTLREEIRTSNGKELRLSWGEALNEIHTIVYSNSATPDTKISEIKEILKRV